MKCLTDSCEGVDFWIIPEFYEQKEIGNYLGGQPIMSATIKMNEVVVYYWHEKASGIIILDKNKRW